MQKNKKNKGFTLVELIIVLAVLLVLSVLAVLAFTNLQEQFAEGARKSDAATIARQLNTANAAAISPPLYEMIDVENPVDGLVTITVPKDKGMIELNLSVAVDQKRWDDFDLTEYLDFDDDRNFFTVVD